MRLEPLGEATHAAGYWFTTVTPLTHQRVTARRQDAVAANLHDVFGWSRPFARGGAGARPARADAGGRGTGRHARRLARHGARVDARRTAVFHSAYPTTGDDAVFFGPDTCRFVAAIERSLPMLALPPSRIADIGCGAGPAAIAIARRYPDAEVLALDINEAALALTRVNAALAGAVGVTARHSNLLDGVDGDFDLIVSNPPYLLDPAKRAYRHGGGERGAGLSLAIVRRP